MKATMFERLEELRHHCGFYHVPEPKTEEDDEALDHLLGQGVMIEGTCPEDDELHHVTFPDSSWTMHDDTGARTNDPDDIGSVLIVAGRDQDTVASIVAGDSTDPHNYSYALP